MRSATRGFVFSADALIAVIIAGIALTALAYSNHQVGDTGGLRAIAESELAVADGEGTLKSALSMSESQANSSLSSFVISTIDGLHAARFNITVYSWTGSGFDQKYTAINSTAVFTSGAKGKAVRVFADEDSNRFGVIELEVWRK